MTESLKAAYSSALMAMGRSALQAHAATSSELHSALSDLASKVEQETAADGIGRADAETVALLDQWGARTAQHLQQTADEVKALLVAVAGTADAVGERDQACTAKLKDLTGRLESIAQLDDMVRMRQSIVESATELKKQVREMVESSASAVTRFKLQIDQYATKLEESEECTRRDTLTKLLNRRGMEDVLGRQMDDRRAFSLIMVDLNHFKGVNDQHGHPAGDDLLRQFADELKYTLRSNDVLGRWGGDEFMVILEGQPPEITSMVERMRKGSTGEYTITVGDTKKKVMVQASFGVANRKPGETEAELIARADKAMYRNKQEVSR